VGLCSSVDAIRQPWPAILVKAIKAQERLSIIVVYCYGSGFSLGLGLGL
jgi:hypothetical protein